MFPNEQKKTIFIESTCLYYKLSSVNWYELWIPI